LKHENDTLKEALHKHVSTYGIIGTSDKIRAVVKQIEQVASSDATVLLLANREQVKNCSRRQSMPRARAAAHHS